MSTSMATATATRLASTSRERGRTLTNRVRTTIEPATVLEVDDAELVDFHRQSILHSFERTDATNALGLGKSPNRWRNADTTKVEAPTDELDELDDDDEPLDDKETSQ